MSDNEMIVTVTLIIVCGLLSAGVIICDCMSNAPIRSSSDRRKGGHNRHDGKLG